MNAPILLALCWLWLTAQLAAEDRTDQRNDVYFEHKRLSVEFVPATDPPAYTDTLTEEDRRVLDLYVFDQHLSSAEFRMEVEESLQCPKQLFRSLGLEGRSNYALRTTDVTVCDHMRYNCCTNGDLAALKLLWTDYSTYLQLNHHYYSLYVKAILRRHEDYVEAAARVLAAPRHRTCRRTAEFITRLVPEDIDVAKVEEMMRRVRHFDLRLKKGFQCLLCDFDNNRFVQPEFRSLTYSSEMCLQVVEHTIEFHHFFGQFVWRYLNTVNFLSHCVDEDAGKLGDFSFAAEEGLDFLRVDNSLYDELCYQAHLSKNTTAILQNCVNYCHKYSFWNYGGIFPDVMTLSKMYKNIQLRLMKHVQIGVAEPLEEYTRFVFPFDSQAFNVFQNFEPTFQIHGIRPQNLFEFVE